MERAQVRLTESFGARTHLRSSLSAGDQTGQMLLISLFPNAIARGEYVDEMVKPENGPKNVLVQMQRAGTVTLISRVWLNEEPATEELPAVPVVLSSSRVRFTAGHEAEGRAALMSAKSIRESLGVESHVYVVANGGPLTGVRMLTTHASSYRELAETMARISERTEGHGPLPMAFDAGTLVQVGSIVSTLVAL
ncbi:MAG: hypothetical protein U0360_07955 [Dehalococcoidia bacterium]